ncbi:MAG: group II intron reverse transcriptase/maturase [Desulfatirhabdiaceae bacterium]|nr:group II intron reverse transcriptase/maturase [Desulfatirhabdiaceae bacterium]
METKLQRIAEKARKEPDCQFTSLFHLMDKELLRGCFEGLRKDAASGIDRVTKEEYGKDLEANLSGLVERLHRMAYIPQPVRRVYIPKPGSTKQRPLGIPALEDKLVQAGLVRILGAIYEGDFIDDSYGFRPGRGCHDALRTLSIEVEGGSVHVIVEADVKGFFDKVQHDWMVDFLGHRIADKRMLRYVKRFLIAGIMEDGLFKATEEGTPQGGNISPILANIYLHYALDLWFTRRFIKSCEGRARLIRYADDFVVCFQRRSDAEQFRAELDGRLGKFGLEVAAEKTKILEFGPLAALRAKARGEKPQTFDFLGLTHFCSKTQNGRRFRMKRKTSRKKFKAKLLAFKEWLKENRTLPTPELMKTAAAKLRGHFAYYGVSDNSEGIGQFNHEVRKLLVKWLNRRGKSGCLTWEKFKKLLKKYPLPKPRIMVNLFATK